MQTAITSSRAVAQPQQASARSSRRQQQLVAFSGFRRAGAVDSVGSSGNATLQAAVQRQVNATARSSGVKVMRVTRMMFERFTEKAIKVVMLAQEEARRLGHNFVGTEQILLGLIGESTGEAGVPGAASPETVVPLRSSHLPASSASHLLNAHMRAPCDAQVLLPRCSSPWA